MDSFTLAYLQELMQIASQAGNSRNTLEQFVIALRKEFVFDNVAVYLSDKTGKALDITYARAIGRAKTAEADAAWGETFASQVVKKGSVLLQDPQPEVQADDRLHQAYLLGLPMRMNETMQGAVIFVRFGGPPYETEHMKLAAFAANLLSLLFQRLTWDATDTELRDLKRQMQLQEDFVSTISHELRTPLGFIKGYSTSLLREDTSWDAETQKEFLKIIDEEADRLSLLIENVLEAARLQSRTLPLRFQTLRLDSVLRDVVTRLRVRHKDLDVSMDLKNTPSIQGDGVRLAQVFDNLFTNAIKYAPNAPITVLLEQVGNQVIISFIDRGPGIPKEALAFIFDRFYRVRTEKSVTGTGLGLYICKQIIEAHRGKIWAESDPGQGTTFFIELPINSTN
ncbi:MAG TPA: HAMP domain-containing sensor histidine kinase [Anaerolineales bacterium]|nr:HAMP domain-containing sensor histidine kinase [Anaerolineales bacterium]